MRVLLLRCLNCQRSKTPASTACHQPALTSTPTKPQRHEHSALWGAVLIALHATAAASHKQPRDKLVRFVEPDIYETSGGCIGQDLFAQGNAGVYLNDAALLRQLAQDKLTGIAAEVKA